MLYRLVEILVSELDVSLLLYLLCTLSRIVWRCRWWLRGWLRVHRLLW
jgi:hypothetical protein